MNRIGATFDRLKFEGRKALVTFVTAGDPDMEQSAAILAKLPEAGADIIEIGMPFSDPMADGPAVQASSLRALKAGMDLKGVLKMLHDFRSKNDGTPVILMGYFNPILAYGPEAFAKDAAEAGADGLIIVDLPPEEDEELRPFATQAGLEIIRLITPTTDAGRLPVLLNGAGGFLYYVSITGVTGTKSADAAAVAARVAEVKNHTDLPVVVGFGVKTPEDAAAMANGADGVVVGSALVENICSHKNDSNISGLVADQVRALAAVL